MKSEKFRFLLIMSLVAAIILALFIWRIVRATDREMRKNLLRQAELAVQSIDTTEIKNLTFTISDKRSDSFKHLEAQMKVSADIIGCRSIYSMVQHGRDIVFGPESLVDGDRYSSEPGTLYYKAPVQLKYVFIEKRPVVVGPYHDEYGVFVSVFAPVLDPSTNELLMVLGMDIEASTWRREQAVNVALPVFLSILILSMALLMIQLWRANRALVRREAQLSESESKYRLIADNMADTIAVLDLDLRFTYISPSIFHLRGYTAEEVLHQSLDQILTPDSLKLALPTFREEIEKELTGKADPDRTRTIELEEYRKDGSTIWLTCRASFLRDETGKPKAIIIVSSDYTEQRRAKDILDETNKRLNDIIEFLPDATAVIDREGCVIAWNKAMEEVTGIPKSEMLGKGDYEYAIPFYGEKRPVLMNLVMEMDRNEEQLKYMNLQKTGDILRAEVFAPMPAKGEGVYIFVMAAPLRNAAGEIVGAIESIRDITERQKTEEALRNEHDQLLSLFNSLDEIVYVADMETYEILFVNRVAQATFGNKPLIGCLCYKEFHGFDTPCDFCSNPLIKKLKGQPHRWEFANPRLNRHFSVIDRVIRWPDGRDVRFEMATDITDLKRAEREKERLEDQLRQAMKMEAIGRLAGGVAHDFNNLLTGITGYSEMIMAGLNENDPLYADLTEIKFAGERAAALTAQLLAFSRKQIINPKVINLNALLNDSTKMLKRLIGEDIELTFIPFDGLGKVRVDPHQMEQVLINLAVNARDAMPDGGKLTIETANVDIDEIYAVSHVDAKVGVYVLLSVSDNGSGMSADTLGHLFEPFFTTKEKGKGTGLGLSMVYGIIKQSGGFINIYSEVASGTVIKVYLPLSLEEMDTYRKSPAVELPTGKESILLVEDEDMVRNFAQKILRRQGYKVMAFSNGGEALLATENPAVTFDLLLTDVIMPGMNGRQLHDRLVQTRPNIRVLYMSGYTENTIAHHGLLDEGVNFIQKPFSIESLAFKVREALENESP